MERKVGISMAKAILIMDMPESCGQCPLRKGRQCFPISKKDCVNDIAYTMSEGTRAKFCPLKSVPEKDSTSCFPDEYQDGYKDGWNDCINEICGKE